MNEGRICFEVKKQVNQDGGHYKSMRGLTCLAEQHSMGRWEAVDKAW